MARAQREHKTSGEVYETFKRIGKVGGATVKGLSAGGKVFNVIMAQELLNASQIKQACLDAGVDLSTIESAFDSADQFRKELGMAEERMTSPRKRQTK